MQVLLAVSHHETRIVPKVIETGNKLTRIAQQLIQNSKYAEVRSVQCEVREGILVLRGQVSSYHLKQLTQEVVRQVEGIGAIANCVEVAYPCQEGSDGFPFHGKICIGPYSVLVLPQNKR